MNRSRPTHGESVAFTPARRERVGSNRKVAADPVEQVADDLDDLERGRALAVLAALGRIQLRLDVMAREQREGLASLEARLTDLQRWLEAESPMSDPEE